MKSSSPDKTYARITLSVDAIMEHIGNNAYFQSKAMKDAGDDVRALMADIAQDENRGRVMQIIELSVHEFYAMIFDLLKSDTGIETTCGTTGAGDRNPWPYKYTVSISLPLSFPETALYTIGIQAQEYVVCKAMNDWCSIIVQPDLAAVWDGKAKHAEEQISAMLTVRTNKKQKPCEKDM